MPITRIPIFRIIGSHVLAIAVLCGYAAQVTADPVFDVLDVRSGAVSISSTGINFTTLGPTGIFGGVAGTAAVTADLSFAAPAVANFIVFAALPVNGVASASLGPGVFSSAQCGSAPAAGQTCTPSGTALNLTNTSTGVLVSFTVEGTVGTAGGPAPITGVYTMQIADSNYQSVLATLASGGTVTTSYSAEFSTGGASASRVSIGGSLALSSTGIDFSPAAEVGAPSAFFTIAQSSSGLFAPLTGTQGAAQNLLFASTPVGAPVNVLDFLTFAATPTLSGDLTLIPDTVFGAGQCAVAPVPGQTCGLPGSAFSFVNVAGGSIASFDVHGVFDDIGAGDPSPYLGLFSFQFAGLSYQAVLAQLAQGQSMSSLYSASFATPSVVAVPEPATLALVGLGLAGLGFSRRRC